MSADPVEAIVFDFDYTLADSSEGIIDCVRFALARLGIPFPSDEAIRLTIGLSLSEMLFRFTGVRDEARAASFSRLFIRRADEVMAQRTFVLAPVAGAVRELRSRGFRLGIVSTKYRHRIENVLGREALLDFFPVIVGGEDVPEHKPHPGCLLAAIERLGADPARVLYVGDSVTDAETAARAGVSFVAVLSGVTAREAFRGHEVAAFLGDVGELPAWLNRG